MRLVGIGEKVGGRLRTERFILGFLLGGTRYIYSWGGMMHFLPDGCKLFIIHFHGLMHI